MLAPSWWRGESKSILLRKTSCPSGGLSPGTLAPLLISHGPCQMESLTKTRICLDGFLWYNDHQVGGHWGCSKIWGQRSSRGHLGSLFEYAQNALRLHDSIDFDETWVKRFLARGSFGVFRNFWSEVMGSFGVTVEGQIFNGLLLQIWLRQCVGLGQPSTSGHGDLFVRPLVKGSKVRKVHMFLWGV